MNDTIPVASPPESASPDSFNHKAANYAVVALIGPVLLNVMMFGALSDNSPITVKIRSIISLLMGAVMLTAIPAGAIALFGIRKHGKKRLLWKGLLGIIIPTLLAIGAIPAYYKVRQIGMQKQVAAAVDSISKAAPKMIDDMTRMDKAIASGPNEITVFFTIIPYKSTEINMQTWENDVIPSIKIGITDSAFGDLLKRGIHLRLRYSGSDNIFFSELLLDPKNYK